MNSLKILKWLGAVISILLFFAALSRIDIEQFYVVILNINKRWISLSFLFSLLVLISRSARYWTMTGCQNLSEISRSIAIQNFLNRVTPFKLGELAFAISLKSQTNRTYGRIVSNLFYLRVLELTFLLAASLIGITMHFEFCSTQSVILGVVLVLAVVILSRFNLFIHFSIRIFKSNALRIHRHVSDSLAGTIEEFCATEESEYYITTNVVWPVLITGMLVSFQYLMMLSIIFACNVDVGLSQALIGLSTAYFAASLAFFGFGTFGTYELGWITGFVIAGLSMGDAVNTAVISQLITVCFSLIFVIPALLTFRRTVPTGK